MQILNFYNLLFFNWFWILKTITGDFESRFNILVRAKREQRDHQNISDYRLQVDRLRGRLNASTDFRDGAVAIKFDGWPDVIIVNL